jgi:SAM-dependent methyltransferase
VVWWQRIKDRVCFPLIIFLSSDEARSLGLTPLDEERIAMARGRCRGLILDIGCGSNELIRYYRSIQGMAIGVDVHPWPGADAVCDTTQLPFPDRRFDTITMLACLNHIPLSRRDRVLQEARRVLKDEGQLVITMINPVVGFFTHTIRHRCDPDQLERGMGEEEQNGLWKKEVERLLAGNGFHIIQTVPFVFGLNRLYIAQKNVL